MGLRCKPRIVEINRCRCVSSLMQANYTYVITSCVFSGDIPKSKCWKEGSEEMMQESPFIEHLIQKYSEQGARENSINNIQSVLTERFPQSDLQSVAQALESILDLEHLTELHRRAVHTPSVEDFLQAKRSGNVNWYSPLLS